MKKSAVALFFAAFMWVCAGAQTVQEGVNHLYAERYESAKSTFQRLLAKDPNNIEATYWLGQVHLTAKDAAGARGLYEKALASNGNAPLLMAGMGHVELVENKPNEARARFESAINASKGRKGFDPNVLNAVGRANVNAYNSSKGTGGDLNYAIEKLNEAAKIAPTNADIFLNIGNAYRKMGNKGGAAVEAYINAGRINPALAIAPYRAAMLYKTQVNYYQPDAWDVVLENLRAAVAADPKFAPAHEELYYYTLFAKRDFAGAESIANQIIASSDPSPENDYFKFQTLILQKKYNDAETMGKDIIAKADNNPRPRVYRAMTDVYLNLKDTATACTYINQFFTRAAEEDVLATDYFMRADACGRGNPNFILENIILAVGKDSLLSRQVTTLRRARDNAKAGNNRILEGRIALYEFQLRQQKGSPTNPGELIGNVVLPFYFGGAYELADSVAQAYSQLAPDSIYGYYWSGNARAAIDTGDNQQGLFIPQYEKTLELAVNDTTRFASMGTKAASSLAIHYANVKRDYPKALEIVTRGLQVDGDNANLLNIKRLLENSVNKRSGSQPAKTTTPASKTTGAANTNGSTGGRG